MGAGIAGGERGDGVSGGGCAGEGGVGGGVFGEGGGGSEGNGGGDGDGGDGLDEGGGGVGGGLTPSALATALAELADVVIVIVMSTIVVGATVLAEFDRTEDAAPRSSLTAAAAPSASPFIVISTKTMVGGDGG